MITNVYIDGVQINNSKRYLVDVPGIGGADIDISSYARGGRDGVALSRGFYRGFVISMEFFIIADSASDLITQRDAFLKLFALKDRELSTRTKRLGFELADGTIKEIPVIFTAKKADPSRDSVHTCSVFITAQSEIEYFTTDSDSTKSIPIHQGGGMAIPMAIPMDMSDPIGGSLVVVTNNGNTTYYPIITVYGSFTGFSLTNGTNEKTLSYSGTLGATDVVVFDMYNRTALLNGVNALDYVSGDWWGLTSGDNIIKLITTNGDGYASFAYRSAYLNL